MKNLGAKTLFFPLPVLIIGTYDEKGTPNAMNAAWGGIYDYNKVTVSMSEHKTTKNFKVNPCFTIAFADAKHVVESDYVGIVSANEVPNKVEKCGLKSEKAEHINAPIFVDYPVTLECIVDSFKDGTLIGTIVNVCVNENVLDEKGNIDYKKCDFIAYNAADHSYVRLGDVVGHAFSDGNKIK